MSFAQFTRCASPSETGYKRLAPKRGNDTAMQNADTTFKQFYTEAEAAMLLGISISRLRNLLDEHIFNDGTERPVGLRLQASDLVLLRFWNRGTSNPKVVCMPKRG